MGRHRDYKHPSDEPGFAAKCDEPVWYLSHPLAPDDRFTFEQNMDHIVHLIKIAFEEGYKVVAPYHTVCLALTDDDMKYRVMGLQADLWLCKMGGYVMLTGHRLSTGMSLEAKASMECPSGGVIQNFVGYNDDEFRIALRMLKDGLKFEESYPSTVE